ncbi:hypothetical protein ACVIIV_003471 [Bradyrhizobium sp. USDA 4354]
MVVRISAFERSDGRIFQPDVPKFIDTTGWTKGVLRSKPKIGICCFSDTNDNELMWAHYAANYSGICVAYLAERLTSGPAGTVCSQGLRSTLARHSFG